MQNDTKTALVFGVVIVTLLFAGMFISGNRTQEPTNGGGVVIENGVQVIDIVVKGGYSPSRIEAKAGVPTEIRFVTNGTYDCSSVVVIPALGYQKTLPAMGTEKVFLSAEQAAGIFKGQCGMGMYNFQVAFR